MTIDEIHSQIARVKPVSRRHAQRFLKQLNISPIGARQRPQHYPENSAQLILQHLGFATSQKIISVKKAKQLAGKRGAK